MPAKKYPKIFCLGHKENYGILMGNPLLYITEKLDGSNMRFWLEDGKLNFGTRNVELGVLDKIPKSHMHLDAAKWLCSNLNKDNMRENYTYFGEMMMTKHTLKYSKASPVMGFDIWLHTTTFEDERPIGRFLTYDVAMKHFDKIGMPYIPPIYSGRDAWRPENLKALIGKSEFADRGMEGIVIKAYDKYNKHGRQLFAKIVSEEFSEENKAAFIEEKIPGPEGKLIQRYCTKPRVKKIVDMLTVEFGYELDMTLMKYLPKAVFEDIIEEEWREIVYIREPIDFKFMRKKIAKRCARLLNEIILETAT